MTTLEKGENTTGPMHSRFTLIGTDEGAQFQMLTLTYNPLICLAVPLQEFGILASRLMIPGTAY